jgi:hypothetical protein
MSGNVAFRSAKVRTFAERKATFQTGGSIAAFCLTPSIIYAHDAYIAPAWWFLAQTLTLPTRSEWLVALTIFVTLFVAEYLIDTFRQKRRAVKPTENTVAG